MSRGWELRSPNGRLLASHKKEGLWVTASRLDPDEAQALAAFIAAGPPKREWRIVRTFEEKPAEVWTYSDGGAYAYKASTLTDDDLEEVWSDE